MAIKNKAKQTPSVKEALLLLKDASVSEIDHLISSLHQLKDAREHLESLFSDGVDAVKKVAKTVVEETAKVGKRKRGRRAGRVVKAKAPKVEKVEKVAKRVRKGGNGLGPARPGTLRAMVHEALKGLGPIKTNALVQHLEDKIGGDAGKSFRVRVNQVLINRRDPFIKKVSRGVYKYVG